MAIVTLTNSTSPNTVERATDDQDPYERETQLDSLAHNFDDHDHTAGKNLGVGRVQTASAPDAAGEVRVNGDTWQWWGASAAAVRTAVDVESAQTVSGVKNFSGGLRVNDSSDADVTVGITINQGATDDKALTLKSSDVAHGVTGFLETDTYGAFYKASPAGGGLSIAGLTDGDGDAYGAVTVDATLGGAADATKSTLGHGVVRITASVKSGATQTVVAANGNLLSVENAGATKFLFDADGDSHQDVGTAWTNFDTHDDVALLTTLAHHVARPGNAIRAEFGKWLTYHRAALEEAGLVTFNDDGHHFVNMSRLTMLLVGAVRQQAAKVAAVEARLAGWERRLLALEATPAG